jgi:hypothetical protein
VSAEDEIIDILRALPHTGETGFEGVVAGLMEEWTGERFYLSGSGRQFGRDAGTGPSAANSIKVECKHYDKTSLNERELIAEITQASQSDPQLDLWVVVTTAVAKEQQVTAMSRTGDERGVTVLILDRAINRGLLLPFVAQYPAALHRLLARANVPIEASHLDRLLDEIRQCPTHAASTDLLARNLRLLVGYSDALIKARTWVDDHVKSEQAAKTAFAQKLDVRPVSGPHAVPRRALQAALDGWLSGTSDGPRTIAIVGEEGSGKTWATIDWLIGRQGSTEKFPLVAVATYNTIGQSPEPAMIVANALSGALPSVRQEQLARRVSSWAAQADGTPNLVLVVDGLNERPHFDWEDFLRLLDHDPWRRGLAVILTMRTAFFERRLLDRRTNVVRERFDLAGYDDNELALVLDKHGRRVADLPPGLRSLVSKPRYCDWAMTHYDRLVSSNDFTVPRLIFEDWRDRYERKAHKGHLDHAGFEQVIAEAAKRARTRNRFNERDIAGLLPPSAAEEQVLDQLISGGVFTRSSGKAEPYAVNTLPLIHGLSLLLVDTLTDAHAQDRDLDEELAKWLEPHADMDLKGDILAASGHYAQDRDDRSPPVLLAILRAWASARNLTAGADHAIGPLCARAPDVYLTLIDEVWRRQATGPARKRLARALDDHRHSEQVRARCVPAVERWLGAVHVRGHPLIRHYESSDDKVAADLRARLGRAPGGPPVALGGAILNFVDNDDAVQLVELALLVISSGSRTPFRNAIVNWAVASSVMGLDRREDDEMAWALRMASEDLLSLLTPTLKTLEASERHLERRAAMRLYYALGTPASLATADEMRRELDPDPEYWRDVETKPWSYNFAWDRDDCLVCMGREELAPDFVARRISEHATDPALQLVEPFRSRLSAIVSLPTIKNLRGMHAPTGFDFERIEPVLAAFAPDLLSDHMRRIVHLSATSDRVPRHDEYLWLPGLIPLLGGEEVETVARMRRALNADDHAWNRPPSGGRAAAPLPEMRLFSAEFAYRPAPVQLQQLVTRHPDAIEWTPLEEWFIALSAAQVEATLNHVVRCDAREQTRTLWFLRASPLPSNPRVKADLVLLAASADEWVVLHLLRWVSASKDGDLIDAVAAALGAEPTKSAEARSLHRWFKAHSCRKRAADRETLDLESRVYILDVEEYSEHAATEVADYIHQTWSASIERTGRPNVPFEWPRLPIRRRRFDAMLSARPAYAADWCDRAIRALATTGRPHLGTSFYVPLTISLLDQRPELGSKLWTALRQALGGVRWEAIVAHDSAEVEPLRQIVVEDAVTDADLREIALHATSVSSKTWLLRIVEALLASEHPHQRGKGMALAAMADLSRHEFEPARQAMAREQSWLRYRRADLQARHEHNLWAKHWFTEFLTRVSDDDAWAAFRLFLRVVDDRFDSWGRKIIEQVHDGQVAEPNARLRFLDASAQDFERSQETKRKAMNETFAGAKVPKGKIYPFIRGEPSLIGELDWE